MGNPKRKTVTRIKPGVTYTYNPATGKYVASKTPACAPASPGGSTPGKQPANDFSLAWPLLSGFVITQNFQEHLATKIRENYQYYNGGVDLAYSDVRLGAPVYAAAPGRVTGAKWSDTGYGYHVIVTHDDSYQTLYTHLSKIGCSETDVVNQTTIIGYLGHSGNCHGGPGNPRGTHLHFELRLNGAPVDPMPYMVAR